MKASNRWSVGLGVVLGTILGVSWSRAFPPDARLDYRAALVARLADWSDRELELAVADPDADGWIAWLAESSVADAPDVAFEDRSVVASDGHPIPVRIYTPPGDVERPFYLDIHGGGWGWGSGFPFHRRARRFAEQTGAIVVSVDYRLAPEHPYPTPLEDCEAVLRWIAREGASLGGDPSRIAVGGDSAGANLAAALALVARDEGGPAIAFQSLIVPATDLSGTRGWHSFDETGEGFVLTLRDLERMIDAYVPDPRQRYEPRVSPLLEGWLAGLPPALVVTARFDPLRDQGEAYAQRLEAAGVPVRLHREEGALHGFVGSPERATRVQAMAAAAVRDALRP